MTKRKKKTSKKATQANEATVDENAKEESGFSFDSIADVHGDIQDESPEPNEAAIAAQTEETVETAKTQSKNVDKEGTQFNPELHAVDKDGNPSVTPLGKFRKRRGASKVSTTNAAIAEQQKTLEQKQAARAAGQLAADMLVGSACTLLGPEWVPIGADGKQEVVEFNEHANLRRAFADYFEAKNISDFPPGIALSIAMTSYAMPRIAAGKETQTRLMKAKIWLSDKYKKIRSKKDAAQSNSGNDGKRKNDDSKKPVSDESKSGERHPRT